MSPFTNPVIVFSFTPDASLVQFPSSIPFFCHSIWYSVSFVYILTSAWPFPVHITSPSIANGISPTCTSEKSGYEVQPSPVYRSVVPVMSA